MKDVLTARMLSRSIGWGIMNTGSLLPVAALCAAVLLWGGSFAAMRVAVQEMNPWSVVWLRMVIAFGVILPFVGRLKIRGTYQKGDWRQLIPMVLFQPCLYFLLEANALRFTTSSQAGVISAFVPLLVSIGAWFYLRESINRKTITGLVLSVGGVVMLSLFSKADRMAPSPLLGNFLELCAMASAAVNMVMVKKLSERYNPWLLTALQVCAGTLFFSPGLVLLIRNPAIAWTSTLLFTMLYLGALVTLCAFGLYNWAMSRIPASRASAFINLVPVIAVIIGWMALGESLNLSQMVAAAAVFLGVGVSQDGGRQE